MELEDKIIMDKYAIGEIKPADPPWETDEDHLADVYSNNLSICCGERLTHYNKDWDDGVCSKCGEHSGAQGGRNDEG